MSATAEQQPSQPAFERALRERRAQRGAAAGGVPDADSIRRGLDVAALDALVERLGLDRGAVERTLHVSARTLARRRQGDHRLTPAESDRLWRLLHVFERALETFEGDETAARTWLLAPKPILGGEAPLDRLDTEPGLREVEDMLTVIDETAAA